MQELCPQLGPRLFSAGFRHGFFGRNGGASSGPYESLNCSYSVGDTPDRVARNLARIAAHLDVSVEGLITVSQVHGSSVVDVDGTPRIAHIRNLEADALVGRREDCALAIRTADCVPVLIGCRATGAAAAIHAGWRGIVAGVIPKAIERLLEKGGRTSALLVAVGPHIGIDAFEVSNEVAAELDAVAPEAKAVERMPERKPRVQLSRLVVAQLRSAGIADNQVDVLESCTYSNRLHLFSFRRDGGDSGRQLSAIRPLSVTSAAASRTTR